MSKETWSKVISIVLMAGIALAAVFGYDIVERFDVVVQPLAEQVAQGIADLNGAPARGLAGAVGDTDLTNLVTTGDVTVGGDLTDFLLWQFAVEGFGKWGQGIAGAGDAHRLIDIGSAG